MCEQHLHTAAQSVPNFTVLWSVPDPDPHHFDADHDGIGCET
jgi:hypothetical protein